jgi:hypothetical protein
VDLGEVNFLFNEADDSGTTPQQTISINGNLAWNGGVATRADVLANSMGTVEANGLLDFINEVRSPGGASGPDPGGLFTDTALLDIYVASDDPSTGTDVDFKSFNVITTNDTSVATGDTLIASDILTPIACFQDFAQWHAITFEGLPDVSTVPFTFPSVTSNVSASTANGTTTYVDQYTIDRTISTTPSATLTISNALGTGNTTGYAPHYWAWHSFRRDFDALNSSVDVTKGNLYMVRWTISGDATTTQSNSIQLPQLRFRVGEASTNGVGQTDDTVVTRGANNITTNATQQQRTYFFAHDDAEIGFFWDVFNFWDTNGTASTPTADQSQYSLSQLEVFCLNPNDLSSEVMVLNNGASSVTLSTSDGITTTPPTDSYAAFDVDTDGPLTGDPAGDWWGRVNNFAGTRASASVDGSSLRFDVAAGNGHFLGQWDTYMHVGNQPDFGAAYPANAWPNITEIISGVPNSRIIRLDVWMRSPNGASANNDLPITRIGLNTDVWGESGDKSAVPFTLQGRACYHAFDASNRTRPDVGDLVPAAMALETASRQYTMFMEPNIKATGATTIDCFPTVDCYAFASNTLAADPNPITNEATREGAIIIDRVVVRTYALPSNIDTVDACP